MEARQGGDLSLALNASISVIITLMAMLAGRVRDVCFSGGRREEESESRVRCVLTPEFAEESCHVSLT